METNNTQNTDTTTENTNGSSTNSNGSNGQSGNQLNDLLGMATPYLTMLTDQAGRVPELLKTAGTSVTNSYKSMSTTTKVVTAGALAVGVGLLVNNMRKKNNSVKVGNTKKANKARV